MHNAIKVIIAKNNLKYNIRYTIIFNFFYNRYLFFLFNFLILISLLLVIKDTIYI